MRASTVRCKRVRSKIGYVVQQKKGEPQCADLCVDTDLSINRYCDVFLPLQAQQERGTDRGKGKWPARGMSVSLASKIRYKFDVLILRTEPHITRGAPVNTSSQCVLAAVVKRTATAKVRRTSNDKHGLQKRESLRRRPCTGRTARAKCFGVGAAFELCRSRTTYGPGSSLTVCSAVAMAGDHVQSVVARRPI